MHKTFRGETIYCAEVERNFPILTVSARKFPRFFYEEILTSYTVIAGRANSAIRG